MKMMETVEFSDQLTDAVIDIMMDAYQDLPEYGEQSRKRAKRYINWLKKHSTLFTVVMIDGEPAGFIAADANWIDIHGKNVGEIHELSIRKKFWGKGIGDYLINLAVKHFKDRNLKSAGLWVGEKNTRAIQFYKKHGFKETGINYYRWLRMVRSL